MKKLLSILTLLFFLTSQSWSLDVFTGNQSSIGNQSIIGNQNITGDLTVTGNIESTGQIDSAKYIIFIDGATVKAKNMTTGAVDFSGANPSTVIESAMNNLTASRTWKEKVTIVGDYTLTSPIDYPSYIIIELQGKLKPADTGFLGNGVLLNSDTTNGNTDIEIYGGTIDGNRANIDAGTSHCIWISGSSTSLEAQRISIHDMRLLSCKNEGIQTHYVSNFVFDRNTISDCGDDGYSILNWSHGGVISNNIIFDNVAATGGSSGIEIEDGSYEITIANNVLTGGGAGENMNGITLAVDTGSDANNDINIIGNVIRDVNNAGISVYTQINSDVENVSIIGNTITDTGGHGISALATGGGNIRGLSIIGNTITRAGTSTVDVNGIYLSSFTGGATVAHNSVSESGEEGIMLNSVSNVAATNNIVFNNGNYATRYGIFINNSVSTNVLVDGNYIYDNQSTQTQNGIAVYQATSNITIINNDVTSVDTTAISLQSGAIATLRNNGGYGGYEGLLNATTTDVGNVGTGTDVLQTYTVPASTLIRAGDTIEFTTAFTFAANGNNKRVEIYFGTAQIYDSGTQAENGTELIVKGTITRVSGSAEDITITTAGSTTLFDADFGNFATSTQVLTNALALQGRGTATADNDIVQTVTQIKYLPAP